MEAPRSRPEPEENKHCGKKEHKHTGKTPNSLEETNTNGTNPDDCGVLIGANLSAKWNKCERIFYTHKH